MRIRKMCVDDLDTVAAIEKEIFSDAWSRQGFAETLRNPYAASFVAEEAEAVVGYIIMYVSFEEGEIANVAVSGQARKHGIASRMLQEIFEKGAELGVVKYVLEVRVSNEAAIALYEKNGFKKLGKRPNFYEKPREDAWIMVRER